MHKNKTPEIKFENNIQNLRFSSYLLNIFELDEKTPTKITLRFEKE